jgi:hypothetical protein
VQTDQYLTIKIFSDGCEPDAPVGHANFFQALMEKFFFKSQERSRVGLSDLKRKRLSKLATPKSLNTILQQFRDDNVESFDLRPEDLMREGPQYSLFSHLFYEQQYGEDGKYDSYDFLIPYQSISSISLTIEEFTTAFLDCLDGMKVLAAYVDGTTGFMGKYFDYHWRLRGKEIVSIRFWRTRALGYYWLQILSETQIELLGGRERILKAYPLSFEFGGPSRGLVLKVTTLQSDMTQRHYVELYHFLRPVLSDPKEASVGWLWQDVNECLRNGGDIETHYKQTKLFFHAIEDYQFAVEKVDILVKRGLTLLHDEKEIAEILGINR